MPKRVFFVVDLPRNAMGKVTKAALRQKWFRMTGDALDHDATRRDARARPARRAHDRRGPGARSPATDDVLIHVRYAGVNRPDCIQRSGNYPPPPGASPIIGLEVAGTIAAVGANVTAWRVGDEVCALTPGGGYAEYCVAPAGHCLPIPARTVAARRRRACPRTRSPCGTTCSSAGSSPPARRS